MFSVLFISLIWISKLLLISRFLKTAKVFWILSTMEKIDTCSRLADLLNTVLHEMMNPYCYYKKSRSQWWNLFFLNSTNSDIHTDSASSKNEDKDLVIRIWLKYGVVFFFGSYLRESSLQFKCLCIKQRSM